MHDLLVPAAGWLGAIILLLAVLLAWHLTYTAARLHRLHTRVEGTLSALDGQLVRRAETALALASSGLLDPAASLALAEVASDCLDVAGFAGDTLDESGVLGAASADRAALESDLSATLRGVLDAVTLDALCADDDGRELVERLAATGLRVRLARRFHADAVDDAVRVRRTPLVRLFRLGGHTPMPAAVRLDDRLPEALHEPRTMEG